MSDGWRATSIGELAEVYDGPHATPPKADSGPIFLGISSLDNGRLSLADCDHLGEDDFVRWTRRVTPQPGDIVFSYETRLGEAALIPAGIRCCLGRRMGLLRVRRDRVEPRFLLYAYLGPEFQEVIRSRTIHGSTVDRIPLIDLPGFPLRVPSLAEQQRIAAVLGALDDKIELNRRMNQTLEEMARALFKSWFVDFDPVRAKAEGRQPFGMDAATAALFPDSFTESDLGELPSGWGVDSLGQNMDLLSGYPFSSESFARGAEGIRLLRGANVAPLRVTWDDTVYWPVSSDVKLEKFLLAPGDILIAMDRPWIPAGLKLCLVGEDDVPSLLVQRVARLRPSPSMPRTLLYWTLREPRFERHLLSVQTGTTIPHISARNIGSYRCVVPPPPVGSSFDRVIDPLFRRILSLSAESRSLVKLRDYLLPKLLSGEIRVKEAEHLLEQTP